MPDAPAKLCECGCGNETNVVKITNRRRGVVKGERARFLPGHYSRIFHEISEEELQSRRPKVAERYREGKSLREIGSELGLTKSQVHTTVVNLRRSGDLPSPAKCQAITSSGRRCGSSASANGYCGGHGPNSGRPPSELPVPVGVLAERYLSGETLEAISVDCGIGPNLIADRLKKAGVELRPRGCQKGKAPWSLSWLKTEEIVDLWNQGHSLRDLSTRFGVSTSTLWNRIVDALGNTADQQLRRLYVEEELPMELVAEHMKCSATTVLRRLRSLGIEKRNGRTRKRPVAQHATLRQIQRATEARGYPGGDLTPKQGHLLNILRASPEPLSAKRIADICRGLPSRWRLDVGSINACLRRLETRGFVDVVTDRGAGHYRGREVLVWFPATEAIAAATSKDDAHRLREIQVLIEEQEREEQMIYDQREIGHWADKSIDAPLAEDGFTILDTLADQDDVLAEMGQAA
jgi:DNA-binding MarR family transcriptional regulator/lambda repressor-like predicted transcriptional regulator